MNGTPAAGSPPAGILLVDKPVGPTCREVLDALETRLALGPMGHAGTLDPLASGLLVALVGSARRLQAMFMEAAKTYEAVLHLGTLSATLDGEGPLAPSGRPPPALDGDVLPALCARFCGEIEQVPPAFSAVHHAGERAHRRARRGEAVALPPRRVRIDAIEVMEARPPALALRVVCGPGTYLRSLARDFGDALGCGAFLFALRRTVSGGFAVDAARAPDDLARDDLKPLRAVLAALPRLDVGDAMARRLALGAAVEARHPEPHARWAFAWWQDEPLCRIVPVGGRRIRSALLLTRPAPPA